MKFGELISLVSCHGQVCGQWTTCSTGSQLIFLTFSIPFFKNTSGSDSTFHPHTHLEAGISSDVCCSQVNFWHQEAWTALEHLIYCRAEYLCCYSAVWQCKFVTLTQILRKTKKKTPLEIINFYSDMMKLFHPCWMKLASRLHLSVHSHVFKSRLLVTCTW